jgi:DNA-binding CsgD family transcriptional regulator
LGEDALAQARRSRAPEARRLQLTLMHTLLLIDVDRLDDAQLALRRGREARERRGARWNLASYHFVSSLGRFWSGEWDEAIAQFDTAMDFAEEVVVRQAELAGHAVRSMIALHRGDLITAEREATAAEEDSRSSGPQWRVDWMLWARALLLEAEGFGGEALQTLTKAWELCSAAGVVAEYPVIGPDLVRLAIKGGEPILAEEVTDALEALAPTTDVASVKGAALRCRGLVDSDAIVLLAAVDAYRLSPRRRELALTCEDAAVALAAAGRGADARPLADEALATFRSFEARRDVTRVLCRLRGDRRGAATRGDRPRPGFGWPSLTKSEVKVAALVAEGLSNPEIARRLFISRRTVQSHVSHALEKLGRSSRVELAVETARWRNAGGDGLPGGDVL